MLFAARFIVSLTLLIVALFCVYGFALTFEPLPPKTQWTWRAIYITLFILTTGGVIKLWRKS
jgi:hypothetical protein